MSIIAGAGLSGATGTPAFFLRNAISFLEARLGLSNTHLAAFSRSAFSSTPLVARKDLYAASASTVCGDSGLPSNMSAVKDVTLGILASEDVFKGFERIIAGGADGLGVHDGSVNQALGGGADQVAALRTSALPKAL